MKRRHYSGQKTLLLLSLILILISAWEASVRLDTMYKPLKMFFSMAAGEEIPLSVAMTYFDWSIFEAPLWLASCILIGLLSLVLIRRMSGRIILILFSLALSAYGLTRESTFLVSFWKLIQPALLLGIGFLAILNVFLHPARKPRSSRRCSASHPSAQPHMTDAPVFHRNDSNTTGNPHRKSA